MPGILITAACQSGGEHSCEPGSPSKAAPPETLHLLRPNVGPWLHTWFFPRLLFVADETGGVLVPAWCAYKSTWHRVTHVSVVDVNIFHLEGTQAELRGQCDQGLGQQQRLRVHEAGHPTPPLEKGFGLTEMSWCVKHKESALAVAPVKQTHCF